MLSSESSKIQALVAVFLLSLSMLAYEVLLTRIFSITQWNHLSFMVISIALFGFALSGTFLSICESRLKENIRNFSLRHSIKILIVLYSISAVIYFFIKQPVFQNNRYPISSLMTMHCFPFDQVDRAYPMMNTKLLAQSVSQAVSQMAGTVAKSHTGGSGGNVHP